MTNALAVQSPRAAETQLISRLNTFEGVRIQETHRTGKDGQFEIGPMMVEIGPDADLAAITATVEASCAPAKEVDVVRALTRLVMTTAAQGGWNAAKLSAYSEILAEYPGDAVMDTLTKWHKRGSKWFPTVPELVEVIEIKARRRLRVRDALAAEMAKREAA